MAVNSVLNKKAQGLPLQAIIIALLLLVVLVVMVAVFRGGLGKMIPWFESTASCSAQKGSCVDSKATCESQGGTAFQKAGCPEKGSPNAWCCIKQND